MTTESIFLDTSGWIALLSSSDAIHTEATDSWRELLERGCSIVVTDWVVAETGNGLARTPARNRFHRAVRAIESSSRARLIKVSDQLFDEALELYSSRQDKTWGLIDCASFVVMQHEGISAAFTTDRHFVQAGFERLLRSR
jgi:hypothetical protein